MTIQIGDRLPEGTLAEFVETETAGCTLGPNTFQVADLAKGKTIAIFGLPGALRQPARRSTCLASCRTPRPSRPRASMKSGASR